MIFLFLLLNSVYVQKTNTTVNIKVQSFGSISIDTMDKIHEDVEVVEEI